MRSKASVERVDAQMHSAQLAVLGATALFGICNIAWRYGHGNIILLSFERAALGALLLAPIMVRDVRAGVLRKLVRSKSGVAAVLAQGSAGVGAALIFHSLPGPQSAVVVAVLPALLIVPSYYISGRRKREGICWVLLSVVAASVAALSGGLGQITVWSLVVVCIFLFTEVLTTLSAEHARQRFSAMTIVAWGLAAGAIGCGLYGLVARPAGAFETSGFVAALVVAVFGTAGRVLRDFSLPHLGAAINYSTAQVTALIIAVGGVLLFHDHLTVLAALLAVTAAASSVVATMTVMRKPQNSS